MKTVTITLTVDEKIKEGAEKAAKRQGISLNTLLNIFLNKLIIRGKTLLRQQEAERKAGKPTRQFSTPDELVKFLFPEIE